VELAGVKNGNQTDESKMLLNIQSSQSEKAQIKPKTSQKFQY